ncbi:MAG: YidC/Oxa1 family membrane protein insertase [Holdemania massiliensis]
MKAKTDERSQMAQAQELQRLYKDNGINPFGAIISSFIQLPIIMAIHLSVQRAETVVNGTMWGLSLKEHRCMELCRDSGCIW